MNQNVRKNNGIHGYNTRKKDKFRTDGVKNNHGLISIINMGIRTYNEIDSPLKKIKSQRIFKKKLKNILFDEMKKKKQHKY